MGDSSSDEVDEADLPSAAECDRRCREFAAVTCTDTALAMFYLQDRKWSVESAVHDYFESNDDSRPPHSSPPVPGVGASVSESSSSSLGFVDAEPHRVRVLSWNIDGLDQNNVATRAKAVCTTIMQEKPDVVFLQEVVNKNLAVIREMCVGYRCIVGRSGNGDPIDGEYFVVILLRNCTAKYNMHEIKPFYTSKMSRTLLQVQADVKDVSCLLMTSHLESMANHQSERKRQLKIVFDTITECESDLPVIFGGDLNLRDQELRDIGGIPPGVVDVWESTGKRQEAAYTWDMQRNDNLEFQQQSSFRPKWRCRFDRLYLRSASRLKPVYFELVGIQRIDVCHRFPSDHWGILAHFDK